MRTNKKMIIVEACSLTNSEDTSPNTSLRVIEIHNNDQLLLLVDLIAKQRDLTYNWINCSQYLINVLDPIMSS